METKNEDKDCRALFLRGINRMCQNFVNKRDGTSCSTYSFNHVEIKSDEHPGNRIAIEKVFGKDFLENRTSSGSYHFDKSVARQSLYQERRYSNILETDIELKELLHCRRIPKNKRTI